MDNNKIAAIVRYLLWAGLFAFSLVRGFVYGHWKLLITVAGVFAISIVTLIMAKRKQLGSGDEMIEKNQSGEVYIPEQEVIDAMQKKSQAITGEINRICPPQPCLRFVIDKNRKPTIFDSKLGGTPFWDSSKQYPVDSKGKPMAMVFQVNFEQCPHLELLPQSGLLQFFISSDDEIMFDGYGVDYNDYTSQKDFRVVYHSSVATPADKSQLESYPRIETLKDTPVFGEYAVNVLQDKSFINETCGTFASIASQAVKNLFGEDMEEQYVSEYIKRMLPEEHRNQVPDELVLGENPMFQGVSEDNFQMLGFPAFEQYDEREDNSNYDILLLQIPTIDVEDSDNDCRYHTIWGDCGSARLFINADALRNLDFSKVLYEFQCY